MPQVLAALAVRLPMVPTGNAVRYIPGPGLLTAPALPQLGAPPLLGITVWRSEGLQASTPSPALTLLEASGWETPQLLADADRAIADILAARIGGTFGAAPSTHRKPIVVVAGATNATTLLDTALAGHAAADILLQYVDGRLPPGLAKRCKAVGIPVISGACDPWSLLDDAETVYTSRAYFGLLTLIAGKQLSCPGSSILAGWGLTRDISLSRPRRTKRDLTQIFAALCMQGTAWIDPFHETLTEIGDIVDLLRDWRRVFETNATVSSCLGIGFWKRDRIADFFRGPRTVPHLDKNPARALRRAARSESAIAYWPVPELSEFPAQAKKAGVPTLRMEDGFIRSVGLGTHLMPPSSIVVDATGIYFDPNGPSDLETILGTTVFDEALQARSRRLIDTLVSRNITKYNLAEVGSDIAAPPGRRRILVPGQVEDDKSVILGGAGITSNTQLLERVRAAHPDAFIAYKPHPDVQAGLRKGAVSTYSLARLCDTVIAEGSITSLLFWADEIHTLTSLTGFEAILRRRKTIVYGQPFYAGWGLTEDLAPVARRGRDLNLEELVAGTLILYPRYVDPVTRLPCGPEVIIERLADPELWKLGPLMRLRVWQGRGWIWVKQRLLGH